MSMDVLRFPSIGAMYRGTIPSEWHPLVRATTDDERHDPYIVVLPSHSIEYVTMMPALLRHEFKRGSLSSQQTSREFEEAFLSCTGGELARQQSSSLQNTYRGITSEHGYVPDTDDIFHESETVVTKVQKRDVTMRRWNAQEEEMVRIAGKTATVAQKPIPSSFTDATL